MTSVAYVEEHLQHVLGSRANELARETGCIVRQRKFDGATLVQSLLFGFQQHVHASLEQLASTAQVRAVPLTLLKRFSAVMCEDSSTITLPDDLADFWRGCGGNQVHAKASVKVHTRWDLTRRRVWGQS